MPQDNMLSDVAAIREWLAKESYLPRDLDGEDLMLKKFLHSCYGSLERTKKCIERFCTTRSVLPEVYTSRDLLSPKMQTAFSITKVTTYEARENEILIYQINDPNLEKLVYYDLLKSFGIHADYWLKTQELLPEGHIIIFDMKDITLKVIPKINIMSFRDFLLYLLEGMPVRVQQVHVINCPSYYEKLYALIKPVLPAEICNIMKFYSDCTGLYKYIDKKYLPTDYGGDALSMAEMQAIWMDKLYKDKMLFLNDNMWKADIKKKPKDSIVQQMSGSFKTLSID